VKGSGEEKATAQKCVFCIDRVSNDLPPACVKTCPANALQWRERDEMIAEGRERVATLRVDYPGLANVGNVQLPVPQRRGAQK
jgi:Fe-S-cluster-containing dehydrogenase component